MCVDQCSAFFSWLSVEQSDFRAPAPLTGHPLAAFCLQPLDMASVSASSQGAPAPTGPLQRGIVKMVSTLTCEYVSSLRDCRHTAN